MTLETPTAAAPHRLHPLTILFSGLTIAGNFLLPALVGGFSAARHGGRDVVLWAGLIAGVPALLGAIGKYLSFRYRVGNDALVIDSGVLMKQHRVIPLASVQNVDIREGPLQRALGVVTVKVETATGGAKADAEFAVLGRQSAEALRTGLMARRAAGPASMISEAISDENPDASRGIALVRLSPGDLILAGATANHAGIIVAALAGSWQLIDDLPYMGWISRLLDGLPHATLGAAVLTGLAVIAILLVAGWVVSIFGSIVRYYDFTLASRDGQLHKSHGLWSRHRRTLPLGRIQALRVEESVLRRPLALAAMKVVTAGTATAGQEPGGAETVAPLARGHDVPRLVAAIFPRVDYGGISLDRVHPRSRSRSFILYGIVLLTLAAGIAFWRLRPAVIPLLLLPAAWLLAAWQYRHRGYATIPDYIVARNGAFNRITWLVPRQKLQTLHLKQSPFQRRHGLASVILDTAGGRGHASVRDLAYEDATRLIHSLRF